MGSDKGPSRFKWFAGGIVFAIALCGALVPIRTCKSCGGLRGFKIGDVVDARCKGCGGDGEQTALEIVLATLRK